MTRIRRLRIVLSARFAGNGAAAAREIAERLATTAHGDAQTEGGSIRLADTGQTAGQIGLQAAQGLRRRTLKDGGGS